MPENYWNFKVFKVRDILNLMSCLKIIGILRLFKDVILNLNIMLENRWKFKVFQSHYILFLTSLLKIVENVY